MEMRPIGFDLRAQLGVVDPLWNHERKARFLLREDVERPLSVDQEVWRSQFAHPDDSEWRGVLGHWSDFDNMCQSVQTSGLKGSVIATTIVWDLLVLQERERWEAARLDMTTPPTLGQQWHLLGYDIADAWLLSGLSNCGYTDGERRDWRLHWRDKLNEFHLFPGALDAQAFVEATNARVPEHAPFFVYGLFLLPAVSVQF